MYTAYQSKSKYASSLSTAVLDAVALPLTQRAQPPRGLGHGLIADDIAELRQAIERLTMVQCEHVEAVGPDEVRRLQFSS